MTVQGPVKKPDGMSHMGGGVTIGPQRPASVASCDYGPVIAGPYAPPPPRLSQGSMPDNGYCTYRLLGTAIDLPENTALTLAVAHTEGLAYHFLLILADANTRNSNPNAVILHPAGATAPTPGLQHLPVHHALPRATPRPDRDPPPDAEGRRWAVLTYTLGPNFHRKSLVSLAVIVGDAAAFFASQSPSYAQPAARSPRGRAALYVGEIRLVAGLAPGVAEASTVPAVRDTRISHVTRDVHPRPNTVSVTLEWACDAADDVDHYNVWVNGVYDGKAYCTRYRVCAFPLQACIEAQVQVVLRTGAKRELKDVPKFEVEL